MINHFIKKNNLPEFCILQLVAKPIHIQRNKRIQEERMESDCENSTHVGSEFGFILSNGLNYVLVIKFMFSFLELTHSPHLSTFLSSSLFEIIISTHHVSLLFLLSILSHIIALFQVHGLFSRQLLLNANIYGFT